eukprot:m.660716 g.660716  ORF g.660716 m.660716 type:complete len:50 (+) comp22731_c0_seq12:1100-1249(+)
MQCVNLWQYEQGEIDVRGPSFKGCLANILRQRRVAEKKQQMPQDDIREF